MKGNPETGSYQADTPEGGLYRPHAAPLSQRESLMRYPPGTGNYPHGNVLDFKGLRRDIGRTGRCRGVDFRVYGSGSRDMQGSGFDVHAPNS